ncbi:hypothetical protein [Cellulomonas sp.]|uniref:hypothetical protein n=1 Tax=Cellulomonas sp. TaxID=40001 RepID=UPI003BAD6F72
MSVMTTIKVPKDLRDRLSRLAEQERTTLAGALTAALDQVEEQQFWQQVRRANAESANAVDAGVATMRENVADRADDAISAAGDW